MRAYDIERCLCDLIRDKKSVDTQIYAQAIKEYFSGKFNARKIIKYARAFNIETKVRTYMEVLQWKKEHQNSLIKGGLLISLMIGVAERTTMDMDTTVTGINMEESEIEKILIEIFQMDINNGI